MEIPFVQIFLFKQQLLLCITSAKDCKFNTIRPPAVNMGKFRQLLNDNTYNDRILGEKVYHGDSYLQVFALKEIRNSGRGFATFFSYDTIVLAKINIFRSLT